MVRIPSKPVWAGHGNAQQPGRSWALVEREAPSSSTDTVTQEGHRSPTEPRADGQSSLLSIFDLLPDVLALASEEEESSSEGVAEISDQLVEAYRAEGAPFKWSVPEPGRSRCPECGQAEVPLRHELENPSVLSDSPLRRARVDGLTVHRVRWHGGRFPREVEAFLEGVRDTWAGR